MRLITHKTSFARVAALTAYHVGRLETHKKTKALLDVFVPIYQTYNSHWEKWNKARVRRAILFGILEFCDGDFDSAHSDLNSVLLAHVKRDRDSVVYRTFYPSGRLEETVNAPYTDTITTVNRIVAAHKAYPEAASQDLIDAIQATGADVISAADALRQHEVEIANHRANMQIARIPLVREYNNNPSHLRILFQNRKRLVESFFLDNIEDDE